MPKLAIIHTTTASVEPLRALAAEMLPGCALVNFVDDSILPELIADGANFSKVAGRIVQYARFAESVGADCVLEACSSAGEAVPPAQAAVCIPVVRIDEPLAELAVTRGNRIGVAATLATTMQPTVRLLQAKAAAAGRSIELSPMLIPQAFDRLIAGDQAEHDRLVVTALLDLCARMDVVVLAQASMARVLPQLPEADNNKCLASPRLAMARVRALLAEKV